MNIKYILVLRRLRDFFTLVLLLKYFSFLIYVSRNEKEAMSV